MTPDTLARTVRIILDDWRDYCQESGNRNRIPEMCGETPSVMDDGGVYLKGIVFRTDVTLTSEAYTSVSLLGTKKGYREFRTVSIYEANEYGDEYLISRVSELSLYSMAPILNSHREADAFGDWRRLKAEEANEETLDASAL